MQQYRVNYPLLIGLAVGTLVCSGAVYGLWRWQIDRKSGWLIQEAEKAEAAGNLREAATDYYQYLTIRPKDDQIQIKYAKTCADVLDQDDVTSDDLQGAMGALDTITRDPQLSASAEGKELRLKLVKLYGEFLQRWQDALNQIDSLIKEYPTDTSLQVLQAKYKFRSHNLDDALAASYKLIGYDPNADTFDLKNAPAPHEVEVYTNLAMALRDKPNKPALADRVMDQLIEANPDSARAYLARGQYYAMTGNEDGSRTDINKAYELDPKNVDVLLANAARAANDKGFDQAAKFIEEAKKLSADEPRAYQMAATIWMMQKEPKKAIEQLDEGLKAVKGNRKAMGLYLAKSDLQWQAQDSKGLKETTEAMGRSRIPVEFVEWNEARILLIDSNWARAVEALSRLRPKVTQGFGDLTQQIDNLRGLCYEKMLRPDLAAEQYNLVLQQEPKDERAQAGLKRIKAQTGQDTPEASNPFAEKYVEVMKQPKEKRNYAELDQLLLKIAEEQKWEPWQVKLSQAQQKLVREDFDGAMKLLAEATKLVGEADSQSPKNLAIHRTAIQVARYNPKIGPEKALERLKGVVAKFGDQPALRMDKADLLIATKKEQEKRDELKAELAQLATGIDGWTDRQKVEVWNGLAARFSQLGMPEETRQYLSLSADKQPQEMAPRLALFQLALEANDDAGMKQAQDKILQIVRDKNDSGWLYTEARRKLAQVQRAELASGQTMPEALDEIRKLVERIVQQRPDWHEAYLLRGELELWSNNGSKALENFDRAAKLGRGTANATAIHVRLLSYFGRYKDAAKQLERIPEPLRQPLLGQLYPEILFRTDQVDNAINEARAASEADPKNPEKHYWYSQLLGRAVDAAKPGDEKRAPQVKLAIDEMRKAVELEPVPDAWFSLISYYRVLGDMDQAQATLREAQLALTGDSAQLFLARSYNALGRWFDAETMYRALYDAAPDDLARVQQLAAFYLGDSYRLPDKMAKLTPLVNKILRTGAEGKIPPNDPNLLWARENGARILASSGDYQNLIKAENLLASNAKDGVLSLQSKLEMAEILASRPDPVSRFKAIGLLEEASKAQPLNEQSEIILGTLYYAVGENWSKYSRQMEKAIARFPNSIAALAAYVENLLKRNDNRSLEAAADYIRRIQKLAPESPAAFDLTVRLANKKGMQKQAIESIRRRLPKMDNPKSLTDQQAQQAATYANYLVQLGDLDTAEQIYRQLTVRDPNLTPTLAAFLGSHRDVEQCFAKLREIYTPDRTPAILQVAMAVIRQRRDQVGDKYDAEVQQWIEAGLRKDPESINLLIVQADLYDLQKRYEDAAAVYRKLLGQNDLAGMPRVVVLNNLAFLIALQGSAASGDVNYPLKLVEDAIQIMGPNSEILDTRAVVYTARGEYQKAIKDLNLSVTDNPTASKYFHKAQAHLAAKDNHSAIEAWEKAEALGLSRDSLNRMEFDAYEAMKSQIEQIRGAAVTQTEPVRRAG